ncbi:hypothetical protein F5887DRAFT_1158498 [Amanita rubescens]|nr:hypothetical protein F5887DRAFT_1158498 [Amanita rubescens]
MSTSRSCGVVLVAIGTEEMVQDSKTNARTTLVVTSRLDAYDNGRDELDKLVVVYDHSMENLKNELRMLTTTRRPRTTHVVVLAVDTSRKWRCARTGQQHLERSQFCEGISWESFIDDVGYLVGSKLKVKEPFDRFGVKSKCVRTKVRTFTELAGIGTANHTNIYIGSVSLVYASLRGITQASGATPFSAQVPPEPAQKSCGTRNSKKKLEGKIWHWPGFKGRQFSRLLRAACQGNFRLPPNGIRKFLRAWRICKIRRPQALGLVYRPDAMLLGLGIGVNIRNGCTKSTGLIWKIQAPQTWTFHPVSNVQEARMLLVFNEDTAHSTLPCEISGQKVLFSEGLGKCIHDTGEESRIENVLGVWRLRGYQETPKSPKSEYVNKDDQYSWGICYRFNAVLPPFNQGVFRIQGHRDRYSLFAIHSNSLRTIAAWFAFPSGRRQDSISTLPDGELEVSVRLRLRRSHGIRSSRETPVMMHDVLSAMQRLARGAAKRHLSPPVRSYEAELMKFIQNALSPWARTTRCNSQATSTCSIKTSISDATSRYKTLMASRRFALHSIVTVI